MLKAKYSKIKKEFTWSEISTFLGSFVGSLDCPILIIDHKTTTKLWAKRGGERDEGGGGAERAG